MSVKWHGQRSERRKVKGGGPQGATIGLLEYLSQSNNCADIVNESERFRFLDDLSILEIINLLTVGLTSYNIKLHVPSDTATHNQYIPQQNLKSQRWLGEPSKHEMSQIVEKVHKGGGGVKAKIKIVYISKVEYFD